MNRTSFLLGLACAASGCNTAMAAPKPKSDSGDKRPNILIVYTDDMGIGDLSCFNDGWVKTPNIDRLASKSIRFTHYYSAAAVSSPSRVGLTTGIFPLEWGINTYLQTRKGNAEWHQFDYLDPSAPTMAKTLRSAGYATGHFGKWHMGGGRDVDDAPQITQYGFDEYVSTWESPDPDPRITASDWIWCNDDEVKRWDRTSFFIDRTLEFMASHRDQPCFVNLWPDDMHTPWVPSQKVQDNKESFDTQPNFREVLKEYDRQIGRLMEGLKELGLDQNTIVIFTSDNGPAPSFKQKRTNGERGQKCSLYEGGINMPFMIHWPAEIKKGSVNDTNVICSVDLLPSLCAIADAPLMEGYTPSGEDMSKVLTGRSTKNRSKDLMWEYGQNRRNINAPDQAKAYNTSPHLAIRRGDMKLLTDCQGTVKELYNLKNDPNETVNIAAENPELVEQLFETVKAWWDGRAIREKL